MCCCCCCVVVVVVLLLRCWCWVFFHKQVHQSWPQTSASIITTNKQTTQTNKQPNKLPTALNPIQSPEGWERWEWMGWWIGKGRGEVIHKPKPKPKPKHKHKQNNNNSNFKLLICFNKQTSTIQQYNNAFKTTITNNTIQHNTNTTQHKHNTIQHNTTQTCLVLVMAWMVCCVVFFKACPIKIHSHTKQKT